MPSRRRAIRKRSRMAPRHERGKFFKCRVYHWTLDARRWTVFGVSSRSACWLIYTEYDVGVGAVWSVGDMIAMAHGLVERSWSCGGFTYFYAITDTMSTTTCLYSQYLRPHRLVVVTHPGNNSCPRYYDAMLNGNALTMETRIREEYGCLIR